MNYLCLVFAVEASHDGDTARSENGVMKAMLDFEDELRQSGHSLLFAPVPPASTTTIWIGHSAVSISAPGCADDPLRACFLLQARDLNEAIRVTGRMRGLRASRIEIRPVLERSAGTEP